MNSPPGEASATGVLALLAQNVAKLVKVPRQEPKAIEALRPDDARAIIAHAKQTQRVVVVGASFIGLEVAASLRARNLLVDVVAPEKLPLERVMGTDVGEFIRSVHESNGVVFHLGATVDRVFPVEGRRSVHLTAKAELGVFFGARNARPGLAQARQNFLGVVADR